VLKLIVTGKAAPTPKPTPQGEGIRRG
jgi:hypothetical protein